MVGCATVSCVDQESPSSIPGLCCTTHRIINKDWETWGSFQYKEAEDVMRFDVTPEDAPHQEWLRYGFDDLKANSATAFMHWEKKKLSFSIETD